MNALNALVAFERRALTVELKLQPATSFARAPKAPAE
jgi:hypothetical protein